MIRITASTLLVLALAVPAAAQSSSRTPIGFRAFGDYEMVSMSASKTFDAVVGSSSLKGPGGGVDVLNVWKGLFVRGAVSQMKEHGSRAFVFNNEIVPLDIPFTVTIRTTELGGGWRMALKQSPRLSIYGGAGALLMSYKEDSEFAAAGENVSDSFNGYNVFGGVDYAVWKWIVAGVEGQYRSVPNAIGAAGVSQLVNEKDLGGAVVRIVIGVRK